MEVESKSTPEWTSYKTINSDQQVISRQ